MSLLTNKETIQHADCLSQYLPDGTLWQIKQKTGSNFRNLLFGLANEFLRLDNKINEIYDEMDIEKTEALLSEWEMLAGIPDESFPLASTISERRKSLSLKLMASMNGTKEDFENLAAEFGIVAQVKTAIDEITFPLTFPIFMATTLEEAAFIMIVDFYGVNRDSVFPFTFPFTFVADPTQPLRALFNRLKPANVAIFYRYK